MNEVKKPCTLCGRTHKRGELKGGWTNVTLPLSVALNWPVKK